jgi:putative sigma-54 modulation protein
MQIHFTGTNIVVTPAMKSFVTNKLSVLEKRFPRINAINFNFHVENKTHVVETTIHLDGTEIHAHASNEDMYQSIDIAIEKLLAQLTKHKEKLIDSHR